MPIALTSGGARVVMLVGKAIDFDARVRRSARSLVRHGYEVTSLSVSDDS